MSLYSYIEPEALLRQLRAVYPSSSSAVPAAPATFKIVDCRDGGEREGEGYIRDSLHFPANHLLHAHTPEGQPKSDAFFAELVRACQHERVSTVVFHCALSQVRGPKSAGRFAQFLRRPRTPTGPTGTAGASGSTGASAPAAPGHTDAPSTATTTAAVSAEGESASAASASVATGYPYNVVVLSGGYDRFSSMYASSNPDLFVRGTYF